MTRKSLAANSWGGTRTRDPGIMSAVRGNFGRLAPRDSGSIRPRTLTRIAASVLPRVLPSFLSASLAGVGAGGER
jgi:hypothetical protein